RGDFPAEHLLASGARGADDAARADGDSPARAEDGDDLGAGRRIERGQDRNFGFHGEATVSRLVQAINPALAVRPSTKQPSQMPRPKCSNATPASVGAAQEDPPHAI